MNIKRTLIVLAHAFVSWALCTATMLIGMAVMSLQNALIVHAIGAPIFAGLVSLFYYRRFHYTTPLQTAVIFVAFAILVDFFVIALLVNKSLEMFTSLLGTWIPFALMFASAFLTGLYTVRSTGSGAVT